MLSIRSWLRKEPQPHSLRARMENGEERAMKLSDDARNKWKSAEETLLSTRAVAVECLAKDGEVIRAKQLREEDGSGGGGVEAVDPEEKGRALVMREHAQMLDRYGDRLNEAFDRGAAAANTGQENLVALVEVLTNHLSLAIGNLHNVSVNLANVVARAGGGDESSQHDQNGAMLQQLLGGMAMRAMNPPAATPPAAAAPDNGKKKS